jgi:hypothetical protein
MAHILVKPNQSGGVERGVISSFFGVRAAVTRALLASILMCSTVCIGRAAIFPDLPAPSFSEATPPAVVATPKPAQDELAYRDGDRVKGRFIKREGDTLIFKSERFGLLRVPAASAEVILAKPPTAAVAAEVKKDNKADVAVERWPFSPLAMAAGLKDFFGSWHGRFAMAAEMMQDGSSHNSGTIDAHLQRKWKNDEVELNGRYDYALVDDLTSTDMLKAAGVWRHDLPHKLFGVYRPTLEWNRAFFRDGVPADYVLLQQEFGAGINLINTDTRKLRTGLSENLFDTWVTPTGTHSSQNVESVFAELEAKLPWRIVLTDRGVWYYSITDQSQGWENRFEISKKLTETLTIGVRHEIRHNNPDVRSADYRRLRLLFGFDF